MRQRHQETDQRHERKRQRKQNKERPFIHCSVPGRRQPR